ncbi:hypothetical protein EBR57_09690 [bacterium]|nr:hypothetical protein [bacterium]
MTEKHSFDAYPGSEVGDGVNGTLVSMGGERASESVGGGELRVWIGSTFAMTNNIEMALFLWRMMLPSCAT